MALYETIDQVADAYVQANGLKSETAKAGVKRNFLESWKNQHKDIDPKSVIYVDFDFVEVEVFGDIVTIEI